MGRNSERSADSHKGSHAAANNSPSLVACARNTAVGVAGTFQSAAPPNPHALHGQPWRNLGPSFSIFSLSWVSSNHQSQTLVSSCLFWVVSLFVQSSHAKGTHKAAPRKALGSATVAACAHRTLGRDNALATVAVAAFSHKLDAHLAAPVGNSHTEVALGNTPRMDSVGAQHNLPRQISFRRFELHLG